IVLLVFLTLAILHSLIVPITQGEDELAHYRYISFIAQHARLPINAAERQQAWYRADWPPLYHLLVGWTVSGLDTTRPHLKDVGESPRRRLVGEIFYPRLIIYTEDANWPWQDGILAWHIGRFMSIGFTAVALIFTYLTALELSQVARSLHRKKQNHQPPQPLINPPNHPPTQPTNQPTTQLYKLPNSINSPTLFATLTTALLAFTPRFLFTSAMLGDDSLFILLSAAFIWLLLRAWHGDDRWWGYIVMGLLLGLSIATKYSTGLLPLAIIPVVWWRVEQDALSWRQAAGRLAVSWLSVIVGASWWFGWIGYYFNTIAEDDLVFGLLSPLLASGPDVSMRRVFAFLGGGEFTGALRPDAVTGGSFGAWWLYLFQTFWGVPILEQDIFSPWAYLIVLGFCLLSLIGLWRLWRLADTQLRVAIGILILIIALLLPFPILRYFLTFNILETGQGRHILYPAAQAIPVLLMLGWLTFIQGKAKAEAKAHNLQSTPRTTHYVLRTTFYVLPPLALLTWSLLQLTLMTRTYPDPLPVQTTTFNPASIPQPLKQNFGDDIQLLGYDFQPDPDQAIINLTLFWQALNPVDENYRTQIQLVDPQGQPHFTWLGHPLNGLYPTRAWERGDVIRDTLPLPLAAVPANPYNIQLNLLREAEDIPLIAEPFQFIQFNLGKAQPIPQASTLADGLEYRLWLAGDPVRSRQTVALTWLPEPDVTPAWRLLGPDSVMRSPVAVGDATAIFIVDPDWPSGDYHLQVGDTKTEPLLTVATEARQFDLPPELAENPNWTPLEANFADRIKLLGAALPMRRLEPGGVLPIDLAWQSLAPVLPDAVTFAVLLDAEQQPVGSVDRYPAGFYSPMLWANGEVVPDSFAVPVRPDAPPGIYHLHLGLYQLADEQSESLPLFHNGQPTDSSAVVLGPFKVGGPPSDLVTDNASPQFIVNQTLGDQITLLGYDLEADSRQSSADSRQPTADSHQQSPSPQPTNQLTNSPTDQPTDQPTPQLPNSPNSLTLTLYWQADTIPTADYTTFLHLRDASNQNAAQKDSPPAGGRYPTSLWSPGEIIIDEISLPLDQVEPGQYTPTIGLYEPASGARLPVPGSPANEIALPAIQLSH
ncbi:MAG: glycosyltransferase family 39 protein, partial [Anaerolineae bacterium]|nr:glycosyltransferase family 39 protein [Anaerolineae bacterium]